MPSIDITCVASASALHWQYDAGNSVPSHVLPTRAKAFGERRPGTPCLGGRRLARILRMRGGDRRAVAGRGAVSAGVSAQRTQGKRAGRSSKGDAKEERDEEQGEADDGEEEEDEKDKEPAAAPAAPCLVTLSESPTAFTFIAHPQSVDPAATAFWLSSLRPVPLLTASLLLSDIDSRIASIRRRRPPVTEASLHTVAFLLALGLTPPRVLDLFARAPSLLKSRWDADLLPKLHLLLAAGVDLPSIFAALNSIPAWLRCEPAGLARVLGFLQAMGVRREKMSNVVRRAPAVLQYDVHNNLWPWAEALAGMLMQEEGGEDKEEEGDGEEREEEGEGELGVTAVRDMTAAAIPFNSQPPDAAAAAVAAAVVPSKPSTEPKPEAVLVISPQLQAAMERRVFAQFIEKYPRIMSNSPGFITDRVRLLCSPPFGLRLPKLLRSANLLGIREAKLREALGFLEREVAKSSADLRLIVNAQPTILGLDTENLKEKVVCVSTLLDGPHYAAAAVGGGGAGASAGASAVDSTDSGKTSAEGQQQASAASSSDSDFPTSSPTAAPSSSPPSPTPSPPSSSFRRGTLCGPAAREAFHVYPSLLATSVSTIQNTYSHFLARFPPDAVRSLVTTYPYLLSRKWERNLGPKLEFLEAETGLDASEVLHYPLYFTHSLDGRIKPRIRAFKAAGYQLVSAVTGTDVEGGDGGEGTGGDGKGGEGSVVVKRRGRPAKASSGQWVGNGVTLTAVLHCRDDEFLKRFGVSPYSN